ncbi:MAG: transposase [Acidobacteriota bacterium]|nr:transposase [Acidobacteriota bacterium]
MEHHREEIERGEMVVLLEDECHLLWGDCCGYVWGKRGAAIEVLMTNERERQSYYGAVNLVTKEFHLQACSGGNGENTVAYLRWLMELYRGKKLLLIWDGATYHRDIQCQEFLAQVNHGLEEQEWLVTCLRLAANAPDQNPVEDIWLAGKNYVRKKFSENKTFAAVKKSFCGFLEGFLLDSVKFDWYAPSTQTI